MPVPYTIAEAAAAAGVTAVLEATVTAGTGPSDLVYVGAGVNVAGVTIEGITDTQNNVYALAVGNSATIQHGTLWASLTGFPLTAGVDKLFFTCSSTSGAKSLIARCCPGAASATPDPNGTTSASGSSISPSVSTPGSLTSPGSLTVGVIMNGSSGGTPTDVSFGTPITVTPSNDLTLFDEIVSSTAAQTASGTIANSAAWCALIATFPLAEPAAPQPPVLAGKRRPRRPFMAQAAGAPVVRAYLIGTGTEASGTTLAIPVSTAPGPTDGVVVLAGATGASAPAGVTDDNGSYYEAPARGTITTSPASGVFAAITPAGPLALSQNITAAYSGSSGVKNAVAVGVPGASAIDGSGVVSAAGASGTPQVTSGPLYGPGETLLGVITYGSSGGGTASWGTGWTQLAAPFRSLSGEWTAVAQYTVPAGTAPVTLSAGVAGTPAWTAVILPLRTGPVAPPVQAAGSPMGQAGAIARRRRRAVITAAAGAPYTAPPAAVPAVFYPRRGPLAGKRSLRKGTAAGVLPPPVPPLLITTSSLLPSATTAAAYSTTLGAIGGVPPYTWEVLSGSLPPGLALSTGGVLSGTVPESGAGPYAFTVQVTDSRGVTASLGMTLSVLLYVPPFPATPLGVTGEIMLNVPTVTAPTGTPGAIGATVGASTYPPWTVNGTTGGTADSVLAARQLDGYAGLPLALTKTRWYVTETEQETGYTSLPTGLAGLIAAGAGIQCCVRPSRAAALAGGSTLAAAQTSLASFLGLVATACDAAGTPLSDIDITLWTECNDISEGFFPYAAGGKTLTFAQYWAAFAPTILAAGFSCCYNPAGSGASYPDGAAWFSELSPTPSKLYVDQYCDGWLHGVRLDEPYGSAIASYAGLADGSGIPIGLGEYGLASGNPASPPSPTQYGEFISWHTTFFGGRLADGKTNADLLFFGSSNPGSGSPEYNSIQAAGDFKIAGLVQMHTDLAQPVTTATVPASPWTDITGYLYAPVGTPVVTLGRGRPNESATMNPGSANCKVDNQGGDFTAGDPGGQWYGQIGRNTPLRFSVPSQNPYLRLEGDSSSCASCPDAPGLDITGPVDIRVDVTLSDWTGKVLASKWTPGVGETQNSWLLQLNDDATVTLYWSETGSDVQAATSTVPVPFPGRLMVRATLNTLSGAVKFYTAAVMGAGAQLGATVGPGAALALNSCTAPVAVGNYGPASLDPAGVLGAVHEFRLYSGIGASLVADPVFSAQTPGATSFADAQGNTWSLAGTAEISQRSYRWHGEMASAPKAADPTLVNVYVPLAARGIWGRFQQGNAPEYSPMRRALQTQSGALACVAYWPGEDLQGASAIGSAIGGPLMTTSGGTGDGSVTFTGPAYASDSTFACSAPLLVCNGAVMHGIVPAYESGGSVVVRFLLNVQDTPANEARIMRVIMAGGTVSEFSMYYTTGGGLGVAGYNQSGTVFDSGPVAFNVDNSPVWVSMELRPSGSSVDWSMVTLQPGASEGGGYAGSYSGTIGNVTDIYPNPQGLLQQVTLAQVSVQSAWESLFNLYQPLNAWIGELAGLRFTRLCSENGISARLYGPPALTAAMGAQPVDTLPDLLQQVETADRGMLYEARTGYALGYRPLVALVNQAPALTLDWDQGQVDSEGYTPPVNDDQYLINDVTATRGSGGSGTSSSGASYRTYLGDGSPMSISPPPEGAGDYATSLDVNVQSDSQLPHLAGWAVHCGTVDEDRYPTIPVNLAWTDMAAVFWAAQELELGDYIDQLNAPPWLSSDDIRQLAAGAAEQLGDAIYKIAWNAVPESPYETVVLDDPVYGRCDTDGSTLTAALGEATATFQVATTNPDSPLWTTSAADFPFDISLAPATAPGRGEQVTVNSITGTTSPQTFTVVRSVNGVVMAHQAGESVTLFYPPVLAVA